MQPFSLDVNLDDEQELEEFLESYEPSRGRQLANLLGFKGNRSVEAANGLMNYAQNKRAARLCRSAGTIESALGYERICDRIYRENIQPLIECW